MSAAIYELSTPADNLSATPHTLGQLDCRDVSSLEIAATLGEQNGNNPAGAPATLAITVGVLDPVSGQVIPLDATANGSAGTTSFATPGTTPGLLANGIKKYTNLPPMVTITATIATNYTAGTATIGVMAWTN